MAHDNKVSGKTFKEQGDALSIGVNSATLYLQNQPAGKMIF